MTQITHLNVSGVHPSSNLFLSAACKTSSSTASTGGNSAAGVSSTTEADFCGSETDIPDWVFLTAAAAIEAGAARIKI